MMLALGIVIALAGVFTYQKIQENRNAETISLTIDTKNPSIILKQE